MKLPRISLFRHGNLVLFGKDLLIPSIFRNFHFCSSVLVALGRTVFPVWMAAVNPVTMTIAWMLVKRILPQFVRDWTEGAGFNIAYFFFFACVTITLWK